MWSALRRTHLRAWEVSTLHPLLPALVHCSLQPRIGNSPMVHVSPVSRPGRTHMLFTIYSKSFTVEISMVCDAGGSQRCRYQDILYVLPSVNCLVLTGRASGFWIKDTSVTQRQKNVVLILGLVPPSCHHLLESTTTSLLSSHWA